MKLLIVYLCSIGVQAYNNPFNWRENSRDHLLQQKAKTWDINKMQRLNDYELKFRQQALTTHITSSMPDQLPSIPRVQQQTPNSMP